MQNPQQMAAQMAAMNASNGSVDGTPVMSNMPHPKRVQPDPREQLNTYIYDYFLRNSHHRLARAMVECEMKMSTGPPQKTSPKNRANGVDPMDDGAGDDLPIPLLPTNQTADNSFLLDWWNQFWDIYQATRNRGSGPAKGSQYIQHTRNLTQLQNEQRTQRMMMNNPMNAQYQNMMRNGGMPNGVAPNDLKRAAALNNRPNGNPMGNMQMKNPAMMAAQMQRDGSNMDMNGQRPQSPGSNENAPSPNKRPRMDGGMNAGVPGGQFGEFAGHGQNPQKNIEGMNPGVQGSPMGPSGLEGQQDIFAGNGARPGGMPNAAPGAPQQGNHALQDYQMQLMLLEQQNKKRLLMARQEQDNMSGPQHQAGVGAQGFPAAMSPQNRPGPSPNPADQVKRGTPKIGGQGMPGSPLPEGAMQQQRGSPAPMNFDPSLAPPGMPPQFYPQMPPQQSPMMRPPSSHPGANFNGAQLTPQQMEAMRNGQMQQNGAWRGPQQQPGMMPGPQTMGGPMGNNPQPGQMRPPPAPTGDNPRPEPSPSQSNQAPPTPSQSKQPNPKKNKNAKDNKQKPANKKGPNAGATPAASNGEEPPTPTAASTPVAPITPHPPKQSFPQNGQPQQQMGNQQVQQQPMDSGGPPFGEEAQFDFNTLGLDGEGALDSFDFDSFLQQPGDDTFGSMGGEFDFPHVEVGDGVL